MIKYLLVLLLFTQTTEYKLKGSAICKCVEPHSILVMTDETVFQVLLYWDDASLRRYNNACGRDSVFKWEKYLPSGLQLVKKDSLLISKHYIFKIWK